LGFEYAVYESMTEDYEGTVIDEVEKGSYK
jgi:hypothetical protein